MADGVVVDVLHVDQLTFREIVVDQRVVVARCKWHRERRAGRVRPSFSKVAALEVVQVRAVVETAVTMKIGRYADCVSVLTSEGVVALVGVEKGLVGPAAAIRTGCYVDGTAVVVLVVD